MIGPKILVNCAIHTSYAVRVCEPTLRMVADDDEKDHIEWS